MYYIKPPVGAGGCVSFPVAVLAYKPFYCHQYIVGVGYHCQADEVDSGRIDVDTSLPDVV